MKKKLSGLFIASLVISGCAAPTSAFNPKPLPALPEGYKTPYQEAVKNFERSNKPASIAPERRPYFF